MENSSNKLNPAFKKGFRTYDYLLTENNNIVVHYEIYKEEEAEDRSTPKRQELYIHKLVLNGDDVQDELECLIENIESDMELNWDKL